jgi:hypothetical protein
LSIAADDPAIDQARDWRRATARMYRPQSAYRSARESSSERTFGSGPLGEICWTCERGERIALTTGKDADSVARVDDEADPRQLRHEPLAGVPPKSIGSVPELSGASVANRLRALEVAKVDRVGEVGPL